MVAGSKISALVDGVKIQATDEIAIRRGGGNNKIKGSAIDSPGKQTIFIPGSAMIPAITNGPDIGFIESTTNKQNYKTLDFDATTDEYAHFSIGLPKAWDLSAIKYQVFWSTVATDADGVAFALQAVAIADGDQIDTAWGTAVVVTDDAQTAAGDALVTPESTSVTIAGTPAVDELVFFRLFRDVSDANDDMTEDARLLGIKLHFTTNAGNDD